MPETRCYTNGVLTDQDFPMADLSEHLERDGALVWVDLCEPDRADLTLVADELGLHALAVEDATSERQRPKFERYPTHEFLSAYAVDLQVDTGRLQTAEIAVFITSNALVTVRKDEGLLDRGAAVTLR